MKEKNDKQFELNDDFFSSFEKVAESGHLSKSSKKKMKGRLMARIKEQQELSPFAVMIQEIKEASSDVMMPVRSKRAVRRRMLNVLAFETKSIFSALGGLFRRSTAAAFMVFALTFMSVFTFPYSSPVASAKSNKLVNISGDVYVYRDGLLYAVTDEFELLEGDKIHTAYGAEATALFVDNTVSRVAGQSKLNIKRLYSDPLMPENTEVILGVKEGRVWSKVTNLVTGSFNVATLHTLVKADRNATFDVQALDDEKVSVSVVDNFVDVELSSYSPQVKTTVLEGESLIVEGQKSSIVKIDDKDEWVRTNLSKDEFETKLLAQEEAKQRGEQVGALPDDSLYKVKTFKENLTVKLSVNERERLFNQIKIAEKRLQEAELLIEKGLNGSAEKVLKDYKQIMFELTQDYPELIGIDDINNELSNMLARDKRRFYTTLPGSSLYDVKEVVSEVELLIVNDQLKANQVALDQASQNVYQILDLLEHGGETIAEESLNEYATLIDRVFSTLDTYEHNEKQAYLTAAIDTLLNDFKTLNAIISLMEYNPELNVYGVRSQVALLIDANLTEIEDETVRAEFATQYKSLQARTLNQLVSLSEFTGVNEENAATVDVSMDTQTEKELSGESDEEIDESEETAL